LIDVSVFIVFLPSHFWRIYTRFTKRKNKGTRNTIEEIQSNANIHIQIEMITQRKIVKECQTKENKMRFHSDAWFLIAI